jgi:hypothetical protein
MNTELSASYIQGRIDYCKSQILKTTSEMGTLGEEMSHLDAVSQQILDYESYLTPYLDGLAQTLTGVLHKIYEGRELSTQLTVNKGKIDFTVTEGGTTVPVSNTGDGLCEIIDIFIRMFLIHLFKYTPILFLDESLSVVDAEVFDIALSEIEAYAVGYGIAIVYVSHGRGDYDKVYRFEKTGDTTTVSLY